MESECKKQMSVADGKDLEWKFDVNWTQVTCFEELVGLIVMLHVIPNLNSKLDDNEKKFVEACYNKFGFKKNCDWDKTITHYKRETKYSLTSGICNGALIYSFEIPFEKLQEVMKGNGFTWSNIFDMIKKLDSYCYIYFTGDFFNFKDLRQELKEKLKSESKYAFDKFEDDWKNDIKATMTNNRKNWIKKVKLEEKKIIKSRKDLEVIFDKIAKHSNDTYFLYGKEIRIINYYLSEFSSSKVFKFLCGLNCFLLGKNEGEILEDQKCILNLLVDLGFSFDYERFIGDEDTVGEEIKNESTDSHYSAKTVFDKFEQLVRNFNKWRDFDKSILWFDDKNKEINLSILGFCIWCDDEIKRYDEEYNRGFSEKDMSCVLDKFKNEEKGFCHGENMRFFVYMMEHPCENEFRIMKDKKKREQFYLDLMDVLRKSVGENSIPLDQIFHCSQRDFTEEEEEDFIKKNNLQGIEEKTINTLMYVSMDQVTGTEYYLKDTKKQKITLKKIRYAGYFIDIIKRIPKDVLDKQEVKSKIKETLNAIYEEVIFIKTDCKNFIPVMLYVYKNFDLDLSKQDIQRLLNYLMNFGTAELHWVTSMLDIIFENRDKFSLDEKKKLLEEVMKYKIGKFGWSFSGEEEELNDDKSELNKKIQKIQRAVKKWRNKKVKIQKVFRGFSYRTKLNLKEKRNKTIKLQTAVRRFLARKKLEELKKNTLKIQKIFKGCLIRKKLKQKKKMTKICKWLFAGFVILLVIFLFEMLVLKVAFLSVPSILTLAVAIILTIAFLYIDHKFKIFFWKRKPPIQTITEPSIQQENLIFNDKNNLISNQKINAISLNQNLITNPINITENYQNLESEPRKSESREKENITNTREDN